MTELLSPKRVATAIGVSEASLKRWCDRGLLAVVKTGGGHRRLSLEGVVQFLRETGRELVRPELLGLPPTTGQSPATLRRATDQTLEALLAGDETWLRTIITNLFLGQHSVAEICDQVLAPAFGHIGHQWEAGKVEVYRERRACEISQRVLHGLRSLVPALAENAPLAIGGTNSGDPYQLSTTMAEVVLISGGWRAQSFGFGMPITTLCAAIEEVRPRLFWLSVSAIRSQDSFLSEFEMLYNVAIKNNVSLVVGGRALIDEVRQKMRYSAYCDSMNQLLSFAETLYRPAIFFKSPREKAAGGNT